MQQPTKSPSIKEYFKFRSAITSESFIDMLKDVPEIGFIPHTGQLEILRAFDERIEPSAEARSFGLEFEYKYQVLVCACGRRFGKSALVSCLGAGELMIPNSKVLIVSYTLDNCDVIFSAIHKIIKALGIPMPVERIKDMELTLANGSTLRVASNDNVASRLGTAWSFLCIDECKLFSKELYETVLRPMAADYYPLSRTLLISSPSSGWLENYYERGRSSDPKWKKFYSICAPTHSNPTIPRESLEEMERTMPPELYRQEILAQFTSSEGKVFNEFDKATCVFDIEDYPYFGDWLRHGVVFQSIDSGFQHYFASSWFLYVEEIDTLFIFEEYNQNRTTTEVHADNIKDIENRWGIEVSMRWGDPASSQQLCDFSQYDLYYMKADKNTRETVNQVNSLFYQRSEVTGLPKLLISKDCYETIRQMNELMWRVGRDELTKEQSMSGAKPFQPDRSGAKTDFDLCDSVRYGAYSFMKNQMGTNVSVFSFGGDEAQSEEDEFTSSMNRAGLFRM